MVSSSSDPERNWLFLLSVSAMVFVSIIVWNMWAFDTVAHGGVIGPVATSTEPIFSQSSLTAIRTIFADRASEEEKYATGVYRYDDPSL